MDSEENSGVVFLLYHSGGALPEAMVQCSARAKYFRVQIEDLCEGCIFDFKRRGLGEWLFYFADIVFIQQVSS